MAPDTSRQAAMPAAGDDVRRAQALARDALTAAGFTGAPLDARLLVCAATGLDHEDLVRDPQTVLSTGQADRLTDFLQRRMGGEPVARIQGYKEFWGRRFELAAETLVPRPDSETLVDVALRLLRSGELPAAPVIADLGTGSGCLLVSILADCPGLRGIGTDMSLAALAQARRNAQLHGVGERSLFVQGNFAAPLPQGLRLIVANPPYIASDEIGQLARDVRCFDPQLALNGGSDGLRAIAALVPQAAYALAAGGRILLEIGHCQQNAVAEILDNFGFEINPAVAFVRDYAGIVRVLQGVRRQD